MNASLDDAAAPPRIVLDTNVCLDLLVFDDPRVAALREALRRGELIGLRDAACRAEWQRVLSYPLLALDEAGRAARLADYDALLQESAAPRSARSLPRCADPDDQKFLQLAADAGARWLLSRDAAVLRLAKRTQREGLFEILAPGAWCAAWQARRVSAGEPYSSKR